MTGKQPAGIEASVVSWMLDAKQSKWVKADGEAHSLSIAEQTGQASSLTYSFQDLHRNRQLEHRGGKWLGVSLPDGCGAHSLSEAVVQVTLFCVVEIASCCPG